MWKVTIDVGVVWVLVIAVGVMTTGAGMWWAQRDDARRTQRNAAIALSTGAVIAAIGVVGVA